MRRRHAFTLVELLVAMALLGAMITAFWAVRSGGRRETDQLEKGSELVLSATLLQEFLSWDLGSCLALSALPEDRIAYGLETRTLEVPVYTGYEGDTDQALRYRMLRYEFDPEEGVVRRDGKVIVQSGLADVRFRWTEDHPTMLIVELRGRGFAGGPGGKFRIRLAAPPGTNGLPYYRFAHHHRFAERVEPAPVAGPSTPDEDFGWGIDMDLPEEQQEVLAGGEAAGEGEV